MCDLLLGILLVTNGSRGHQLVFHYPQSVQPPPQRDKRSGSESGAYAELQHSHGPPHVADAVFGFAPTFLADTLSPKPALCGSSFELCIEGLRFLSHPTALPPYVVIHGGAHAGHADEGEMTLFNVVFVLRSDTPRATTALFKQAGALLSHALRHEQLRCGYLGSQVGQLLHPRPHPAHEDGHAHSDLAHELTRLFHGLRDCGMAHLRINGWMDIHVSVHEREGEPAPIRPYQTLLLLQPEEQLMRELPADASPILRRLVRAANPLRSFQEIHADIDVSLPHLFRLAAHLVAWRKARVVDKVTASAVYVLAPSARPPGPFPSPSAPSPPPAPATSPPPVPAARDGDSPRPVVAPPPPPRPTSPPAYPPDPLLDSFRALFPTASFPELLARFSAPRRLSEHIASLAGDSEASGELVRQVQWMLQNGLLVQLHTYIYSMDNLSSADPGPAHPLLPQIELHPPPPPGPPSAPPDPRLEALYERLRPLFDGAHHQEEILWRENLPRGELAAVLDAFAPRLVLCQRPGPA